MRKILKKASGRKKPYCWRRLSQRARSGLKKHLTEPLRRQSSRVEAALPAIILLALIVGFLFPLRRLYLGFSELNQGIYIEVWGTVLDILVVGIFLTFFAFSRARKESIRRYLEEIDDFKKWDSMEARCRIAGNIRRLARLGKTDIDFSGLVLRDFSFSEQEICSLKGAIFSHKLTLGLNTETRLENVVFTNVVCQNAVFSQTADDIDGLFFGTNLTFVGADLSGACFDGAELIWTDYKADKKDWDVCEGLDDEGIPMNRQDYFPAFAGANLKHADFRQAENVEKADFTGVRGLQTCFFDEDVRNKILARHKSD